MLYLYPVGIGIDCVVVASLGLWFNGSAIIINEEGMSSQPGPRAGKLSFFAAKPALTFSLPFLSFGYCTS